jgi:hypothetical protein
MNYIKDANKDNPYVSIETLVQPQKRGNRNASGSGADPAEIEAERVAEDMTNPNGFDIATMPKDKTLARFRRNSESETEIGSNMPELNSLSGGNPLGESEKNFFEPRFGADLSKVRVHTDGQAAGMADAINAKAFTKGNDIAFAKGEYQPGTADGRKLLAHELTHVVQQTGRVQRKENPSGKEYIIRVLTNRLIEDGIDNWYEGAKQGVDAFWKDITDQQIDELGQTSPLEAVLNIFGNFIGAATVFAPAAWPKIAIFGISTAGIAAGSLPSTMKILGNHKKSKDIQVKNIIWNYMLTAINDFYQNLVAETRGKIDEYAAGHMGVNIDETVAGKEFKFFKDELYRQPGIVDINKVSSFMVSKLQTLWGHAKNFSGVKVGQLDDIPNVFNILQNNRLVKEAEQKIIIHIPEALSYQSKHPDEGVLFVVYLYERKHPFQYDVTSGSKSTYKEIGDVFMIPGCKTQWEAIKKFQKPHFEAEPPKDFNKRNVFHWIPPMGKI